MFYLIQVEDGVKTRFLEDTWMKNGSPHYLFSNLYGIAVTRDININSVFSSSVNQSQWAVHF